VSLLAVRVRPVLLGQEQPVRPVLFEQEHPVRPVLLEQEEPARPGPSCHMRRARSPESRQE
jgi:hypothetical protein